MESKVLRKRYSEVALKVSDRASDPEVNAMERLRLERRADLMCGLGLLAEVLRDGFVLVAKAIRPSIGDPEDY